MTRDSRTDPQPGDILRDRFDGFVRKIVKREPDRVLVQIGVNNRTWRKLATWRKWANGSGVGVAKVMKLEG